MQFRFQRDDEGRERIYVGEMLVAKGKAAHVSIRGRGWDDCDWPMSDRFHMHDILSEAVEAADEAGFWDMEPVIGTAGAGCRFEINEVVVDVSVPARTGEIPSVGGEP